MKRISILVLLILALVATLVACNDPAPAETHEHSYTDEWCADATHHWHVADCEHTDKVASKFEHRNTDGDGKCDVCDYAVEYFVSVEASNGVTVADVIYVSKATGEATFTASAPTNLAITVEGATAVGEPTVADGVATYTYKLSGITADATVKFAEKVVAYAEVAVTGSVEGVEFEEGLWSNSATIKEKVTLKPGKYVVSATLSEDLFAMTTILNSDEEEVEQDYMTGAFIIEEAGEYFIGVDVVDMSCSVESVDISYAVSRFYGNKLELDAAEGNGIKFPADFDMNLTYVAPETGVYLFTSTVEGLVWNYDSAPCFVYAEAGEEITNAVSALSETGVYEFNWKIEKISTSSTIVKGDNALSLELGKVVAVEFVADAAGTYYFSAINGKIKAYNEDSEELWYVYADDAYVLAAGDKVVLYICVPYAEEDVEDTITVTFEEPKPSFTVTVTDTYGWADEYTFTAPVTGVYTFYFPVGLGVMGSTDVRPIVDFYEAEDITEYSIGLEADATFVFNFGAVEKADFVIEYVVEEGDISIGGGGSELPESLVGTYSGQNAWENADMILTVTDTEMTIAVSGMYIGSFSVTYTYTYEGGIVTLYDETGAAITNPMMGYVTVKSADSLTVGYNGTDYYVSPSVEE